MEHLIGNCELLTEFAVVEAALPWYAIHVRSNFEQTVHRILEQKGYNPFLPTYIVKRRWSDRTKQMNVPLFPGYVFCRLDEQNRLPVLTTPGVIRIIGNGKRPVPITESEIESVKSVLKSNLDCMPWPTLAPGSRITVDRGPLMGVQGVLVKCRNENRLVVSVELLNRAVAVEIDDTWIRPSASEVSSPPRLT